MTTILIHPQADHLIWVCTEGDEGLESFVYNKKNGERMPLDIESEERARTEFMAAGWVRAYVPDINLTMNGEVLQSLTINNF